MQFREDPRSFARLGSRVILFLVAGLPAIALAIPLNYSLVTLLQMPAPAAYAVVLVIQVTLNFFCCRWFVFKSPPGTSLWKQYGKFTGGILAFRILDWGVYVFLVQVMGWYFLLVQLLNVFVFALLKFGYSKRVMEG